MSWDITEGITLPCFGASKGITQGITIPIESRRRGVSHFPSPTYHKPYEGELCGDSATGLKCAVSSQCLLMSEDGWFCCLSLCVCVCMRWYSSFDVFMCLIVTSQHLTGEVPAKLVPVFTLSATAWDDRELVRAFDNAVNSYKRRKQPPEKMQANDPKEKRHKKHVEEVSAPEDASVINNNNNDDDDVGEKLVVDTLVGNVVHVESVPADSELANLLQAHYWAGKFAWLISHLICLNNDL
jgi:hypothetical protein